MFSADASARGQQRDPNHSPGPISETRPAGGRGSDGDGLDGYINNTLAQKFSDLTFDDPPLAPYICPKPESSSVTVPMLMRGQKSPSRSTMLMPSTLGPPTAAANPAHALNDAGERHTDYQAGGVTSRSSHLALTRQKTANNENLLSEAEEALRRHITHKTNRLHAEQGPNSSKAFLSALCTLSTERFDRLWAGVLHASTSATPPARDAGSKPPDSSENGRSRAAAERAQIWERRLERFTADAVGALVRLVNSHWERLTTGLGAREFPGDQFSADKRLRRLCHHLELRELDEDAELHWLRRALALIRNLRDFEEYLEENGHPLPEGSNQRLRHAYLTEIYAAGSSRSDADVKTAFKEDLRYAVRWMIFIRLFGLGAILVCGESISKLVYRTSGNNNGDLEWLATQIQQCRTVNFQALCDILYLPVADMIRHYRVGDHLHKSELITKIQTNRQPDWPSS